MARFTLGLSLTCALAVGCNSTPSYTGNGGGDVGGEGAEAGATSTGTGTGTGTNGTSGTVQGSAVLTGAPFTVGSGYGSVTPPDAGGPYTSFSIVLFAAPLTCDQALTVSGGTSQVAITVTGVSLTPGSYIVGPNSIGTAVSIDALVAYTDGGPSFAYIGDDGSTVIISELDATTLQGSFEMNTTLADGGNFMINGQAVSVPFCAGLQ